jgi:hypothetical protein
MYNLGYEAHCCISVSFFELFHYFVTVVVSDDIAYIQ